MATKITSRVIAPGAVTAEALAPGVGAGPVIANVQIANSSYVVLDDTAVALEGGYILINGENFGQNVQVIIANTNATSVTYISSSLVRAQVPAKSAGSYIMYLVNTDTGATAIRVNAVTYSGVPSWVTGSSLTEGAVDEAISIQLSATSDSNVTYQVQSGSTLPTGLTLSANGLLSGTVTGLNENTLYNFTIEAVDDENQDSPRSFSITIKIGDDYFYATTLLLNGDGANGANNNTFVDSSNNNFAITRNGNVTQGTFSPFSAPDGRWSNYFDGTGDYLDVANVPTDFGSSSDFTIEFWMYPTVINSVIKAIIDPRTSDASAHPLIWISAANKLYYFTTNADRIVGTTTLTADRWYHVALVRNSGTTTLYLDGASEGSWADTVNYIASTTFRIGQRYTSTAFNYAGYLSNLRVVKGTALYTSNFTPTTSPLTAITNTSLLTCQSNRFVDNSSNAFAITRNGDVTVTPFSPFAPTAAYSASVNGGSGYFDGSGDYLTVPANSAWSFTGDACLEAWVYRTADLAGIIFATGNASTADQFAIFGGSEGLWWGQSASTSPRPGINRWSHVCVTRSGSTIRRFIDGELVSTGTNSGTIGSSVVTAYIGRRPSGGVDFKGYIQDLRIINGSIPTDYQTASTTTGTQIFTPPTAPLTTTSQGATSDDVELLLNFTNAGILDYTGKNNLETVGNAQISTSVKKYGTGAMYFDGTGDWLILPRNDLTNFGTGDFTVEGWVYSLVTGSTYRAIFSAGTSFQLYYRTNRIELYLSANDSTYFLNELKSPSSFTTNTWHHFAVVRNGSNFNVYLDGISGSTGISSSAIFHSTTNPSIGSTGPDNVFPWTGYMDDLRITKGVARYTSNFTPPSSFKLK